MIVMKKVIVKKIGIDSVSSIPVILLGQEKDEKVLPIWIGINEASSIVLALSKEKAPRPLTHDLIVNILRELKVNVKLIAITSIQETQGNATYIAEIHLLKGHKSYIIDARPSDSIAIALRTNSPIYINDELKENMIDIEELQEKIRAATIKNILYKLDEDDFGKYKM